MESKEKVFNELIERELETLRKAAYHVLGNAFDADEAIQQAMLLAWQKFDKFQNQAKLSSWVYRITMNCCYDLLRREVRTRQVQKEYVANPPTNSQNNEIKLRQLELAIAQLPTIYKEAIIHGYLGNLNGEQAAALLECSPNTLRQRIHKAKNLLKSKIGEL